MRDVAQDQGRISDLPGLLVSSAAEVYTCAELASFSVLWKRIAKAVPKE